MAVIIFRFAGLPAERMQKFRTLSANTMEALLSDDDQEQIKYFEYPCDSPSKARWFTARITKFTENGLPRLVVSHANITQRKSAEEKIHQQVDQLLALREIDISISSTSDLNQSLDILLQNTMRLLHVDAAAILRVEPDEQALCYIAGHGFSSAQIKQARVKCGEGYAGKAASEKHIVYIPDFSRENSNTTFSELMRESILPAITAAFNQ